MVAIIIIIIVIVEVSNCIDGLFFSSLLLDFLS